MITILESGKEIEDPELRIKENTNVYFNLMRFSKTLKPIIIITNGCECIMYDRRSVPTVIYISIYNSYVSTH